MSELSDALEALRTALETTEQGTVREQRVVCEQLREACLSLAKRLTETLSAASEGARDRSVGEVLLPIVSLEIGEQQPLVIKHDWLPAWHQRVDDACHTYNTRLREGKYGFVDEQGIIYNPTETLNPASVNAVLDSLAFSMRKIALPLKRDAEEIEQRIDRYRRLS